MTVVSEAALPLRGVLVADFSRVLAGPLVTQTLSDLGACVVKVEHPDGDDTRHWGPPFSGGRATYFAAINRGKHSIALDLRSADDLAVAVDLVRQADVLVENFRPGVMDRLGLGHDAMTAINRHLVYCSITGFGDDGPGAAMPGIDLLVQAMAGWMQVTGDPDGPPTKVGMAVADVVTGLQATIGVLAALRHRDATGEGGRVSVSLFEAALAGLVNLASGHLLAGDDPVRAGNRHPSIAPYEPVAAADGWFILAAANDRLFTRACEAIGRPELADDPRFASNSDRRTHADALIGALEEVFRTQPVEHWMDVLAGAGVPVGRVNTVPEAFDLAEQLGLGTVASDPSGIPGVRSPIRFGDAERQPMTEVPELDASGGLVREGLDSGVPLLDWLEGGGGAPA